MPRLRLRLGLGPLALGFALSLGRCGGGPPLMYAYADETEPALVLVDEGYDEIVPEPEASESEPEPEPEASESEPEPEPEASEFEPEPEPEASESEPEPEPEASESEPEPEQVEEVEPSVDISPVVDLLMLCAGSLGVLVGYHAFSGFWRVLGGEQ